MEVIISGLIFGLVTSFHCAGMCGPIAIALPLHGNTKMEKLLGGVIYNLGRTLTYIFLGTLLGLLGEGINALGFQRWLSIITGLLMISTALFPSLFTFSFKSKNKTGFSFLNYIKSSLGSLFSTRSYASLLLIGVLNGFLPCGPLYAAIIASVNTGSMMNSIIFMAMFGLGTMPMLLAISLLGNFMSLSMRRKLSNFIPVVIIILGVLFILRGLNLGIPFLSPTQQKIEQKINKEKEKYHNQTKIIGEKDIEKISESTIDRTCCGS
ncbi:MAG: sulfite exporter TauE/SafE family protein [Saprospiraceae bacterium]